MSDPAGRILAHYEKHAGAWDADRRGAAWLDRAWIERFAAQLPPAARVLDLGCGGGDPVARFLAACGHRITGVEPSPTLLGLCRERLPEQEWLLADMRGLALGRRFDGVLAWDSFFHLAPDDQRAMFPVFAAHLGPGGVLLFNAGPHAGEAIGTYRGDPLYHASLAPADYARLLDRHGFDLLHHEAQDPARGGRVAWLARLRAGR